MKDEFPVWVTFTDNLVFVTLKNGKILSTPIDLHKWLKQATLEQKQNFQCWPFSVYWPDLDNALDIQWMIMEENK